MGEVSTARASDVCGEKPAPISIGDKEGMVEGRIFIAKN